MPLDNACSAIGLVNTTKIPAIGGYVQDSGVATLGEAGPEADGPYIGLNGDDVYSYNALGEVASVSTTFAVPANSGAAAGKVARWVTNTAALTVAADNLCSVSVAGVITAQATTGLYKIYCAAPAAVIPANSWMWAFLV